MKLVVEQYVDEAVRFVPRETQAAARRLRVGRTLLTCRVAVAALNEMGVPAECDSAYRYINVHNPRCPLLIEDGLWRCRSALDDHPVWGINWAAAQLICRHLGGRLPRASEWESFAANNDDTRIYPWGDASPTYVLANYDEHYGGTTVVSSFPPSDIGLYDLAGNLGEWCLDPFGPGAAQPLERVVKGGAWSKDARHLQIRATRGKWARIGTTTIGLRPVWDD